MFKFLFKKFEKKKYIKRQLKLKNTMADISTTIDKAFSEIYHLKDVIKNRKMICRSVELPDTTNPQFLENVNKLETYVSSLEKELLSLNKMFKKFYEDYDSMEKIDIVFEHRIENAMKNIKRNTSRIKCKSIRCNYAKHYLKWFDIFSDNYYEYFNLMEVFNEYSKMSEGELKKHAYNIIRGTHIPLMEIKTKEAYIGWLNDVYSNLKESLGNTDMFYFYGNTDSYRNLLKDILNFYIGRRNKHFWWRDELNPPLIANHTIDALELYIIMICYHNIIFNHYIFRWD